MHPSPAAEAAAVSRRKEPIERGKIAKHGLDIAIVSDMTAKIDHR